MRFLLTTVVGGLLWILPHSSWANEHSDKPPQAFTSDQKSQQALKKKNASKPVPLYKPPLRGAPARLVGAASRGTDQNQIILRPLAPNHVGLTISQQPALYWYISEVVPIRLEFTLMEEQAIEPLIETQLDRPSTPGVQRISLADLGIRLKPDREYEWAVALVPDLKNRSNDIIASGVIQYIKPAAALQARLQAADEKGWVYLFAEEGLWYDAIAAISQLIDSNPNDKEFHRQRAALLNQVELPLVAAHDNRWLQ